MDHPIKVTGEHHEQRFGSKVCCMLTSSPQIHDADVWVGLETMGWGWGEGEGRGLYIPGLLCRVGAAPLLELSEKCQSAWLLRVWPA